MGSTDTKDTKTSEEGGFQVNIIEKNVDHTEVLAVADTLTPQESRRLLRKIDLILMPIMMICYGIQFSDKTSLGRWYTFLL